MNSLLNLCIIRSRFSGYPGAYLLHWGIDWASLEGEGGGEKNIILKIIFKDKYLLSSHFD